MLTHAKTLPRAIHITAVGIAIGIAIALLGLALASTPADALNYVSSKTRDAEQAVSQARADLQRAQLGLSGKLEITPDLAYTGALDDPSVQPEFETDLTANASLGFTFDQATIFKEQLDLLRAEEALRDARLNDGKTALLAQADLLRAQIDLTSSQRDLEDARATFAQFQSDLSTGTVTDAELQITQVAVKRAELTLEKARNRLEQLRRQTSQLGLEGPATFEAILFVLPDITLEDSFGYQSRLLTLRRAEAQARQDTIFGILEDIRVTARYEGTDANLSANLNLNRGRPGVGVNAKYRQDTTDRWSIGLSASFRLDGQTLDDFSNADSSVVSARAELERFSGIFSDSVTQSRQEVDFAYEALTLSAERLQATRSRINENNALIQELEGGTGNDKDLDNARKDQQKLQERLLRDQNTVFRDWQDYVREVEDYLDLVDGSWTIAQ